MAVAERLTVTDLAAGLSEVLERAAHGEQFAIERDGVVIATLGPPSSSKGTTWAEFTARVPNLELPGDGFADDLENIQASQGIAEMPEWPD